MKKILVAVLLAVSGCAHLTHYAPEPWARMSAEQAHAQCEYDIQADPMIGMTTCMARYGWRAVD